LSRKKDLISTAELVSFCHFLYKKKAAQRIARLPRVALFVAQLIWLSAFDPRIARIRGAAT